MKDLHEAAATQPHLRMLGGVAFVHVTATHSCLAETYVRNRSLPSEAPVKMKLKLLGFYCLTLPHDRIRQITNEFEP